MCESLLEIEKSIGKVNVLPTRFFSRDDTILLQHTEKIKNSLLAIVAKIRNDMLFDTCFTSTCSIKRQRCYEVSSEYSSKLLPTTSKTSNSNFVQGLIQKELSDKEIVDHLLSLLCASLSSTTNVASFMCLLLAQHPNIQENLRQEIYMTTGKDFYYLSFFQTLSNSFSLFYCFISILPF